MIELGQAVGIVCGAILMLSGVVTLAVKGLLMIWEWRFGKDIKAAQARAEETSQRMEAKLDRLDRKIEEQHASLEEKVDEHLQWHGSRGTRPARTNGRGTR